MQPSQDFVDNHALVFYRQAEIEVDDVTIPVEIWLTEGGEVNIETSRISIEGLTQDVYPEVTGTTDQGEEVIITDLFCFTDQILSLNAQVVEICRNEDRVVEGEEVTLQADVLGYQYKSTPRFSNPDDRIDLIERTGWRAGSGNNADWSISLRPLPEYSTRVNSIQNYRNLVRTVQFDVSIAGLYGGLDRVAGVTERILDQITWVSSYLQGTLPSYSKLEIREDGDSPAEYVMLRSLHSNVGGSCKSSHRLFRVNQELPLFLDRAYEHFLEKQETLELKKVLGFYVDSLDPSRPVDVKFTNLCIATEMLANRILPDQGCTEDQISGLVNELGVEFRGLIPADGSLKSKFGDDLDDKTLEYFWYRSRNHVIHGGSDVTTHEIIEDYHALLVLLRRLLREILLEGEIESLHGIQEFSPDDYLSR